MTGFARLEGAQGDFSWYWELKGVNGRGLDIRCRLPSGYESLEGFIKTAIAGKIKRGNISVGLSVSDRSARQIFRINEGALLQIEALMKALAGRIDATPPTLDGLLALKGVIETEDAPIPEEDRQEQFLLLEQSFIVALDALVDMREKEGKALESILRQQMEEIENITAEAAIVAARQMPLLRERLARKIAELLPSHQILSDERLLQETALLAIRADVREELDRLAAHIDSFKDLMRAGAAVGRKLDFFCQELHRESNTLCSKAEDIALTNLGIALKAAVEQLREQVQNIE